MQQILNALGRERKAFAFLIDFEMKKPLYWHLDDPQEEFLFDFNGVSNFKRKAETYAAWTFQKTPISLESYASMFKQVKHHLEYGDSFLLNLTCKTAIDTNLSLLDIFHAVQSKYKCILKDQFVCFSPETFISINNNNIRSFPMKGTIDAAIPNAKKIIMNDQKEAAEHATIVDLIRSDLSRVATDVHVERFRYYEEIQTHEKPLGQISSEVVGSLEEGYQERIGDIIYALLPAGSISGAPKPKTIEIINAVEKSERGYYTGIAGIFDGERLDSCVLIRYIGEDQMFRSGGGITFQSKLEDEYNEMIEKVYVPIY